MIPVNELRIGNLALLRGIECNVDIQLLSRVKELQPIPLTPEVLEKCGFDRLNKETMAVPSIWHSTYTRVLVKTNFDLQERGSEWYWIEGNTIVELKYLHQLQNLYFALTGKELEVTLS